MKKKVNSGYVVENVLMGCEGAYELFGERLCEEEFRLEEDFKDEKYEAKVDLSHHQKPVPVSQAENPPSTIIIRSRIVFDKSKEGIIGTMAEPVLEEYITVTRKNYISGNDGGKIVEKSFLELKGEFLIKKYVIMLLVEQMEKTRLNTLKNFSKKLAHSKYQT
nr:hypothetical protein [Tanacetum cinerariifolium]